MWEASRYFCVSVALKIKHRILEASQKKRTQVSHFCFLHLNQRYGHAKLLSSILAVEVSECSVSQGDESEKCRLGGISEGLWFNLLLKARTSPTQTQTWLWPNLKTHLLCLSGYLSWGCATHLLKKRCSTQISQSAICGWCLRI